jgi:predicted  nucleic acid-binding Zn-ribbon protein
MCPTGEDSPEELDMTDTRTDNRWKEALDRDLAQLATARDELRVQLELAKAEIKDEWSKLEDKYQRVEGELRRIGDSTKAPAKDIGQAARTLLDEIKHGYDRVKRQLDRS